MGGFISAPTNLASPSAIGSTTPNTGAFTTLSANNGTITTNSPAITLAQTWNAAGTTFTSLRVNVTDTASNASSLLMDLQVGGTSKFIVDKGGAIIVKASTGLADRSISGLGTASGFSIDSNNIYGLVSGQYAVRINRGGDNGVTIRGDSAFGITSGAADATQDTILRRDAADTFAQRRSTNAQTFRIYNTFTDASNYERGFVRWATNVLEIGAEAAGTGTQRTLVLKVGSTDALTITTSGQASFASRVQANNFAITGTSNFIYNDSISNGFKFTDGSGLTSASGGLFLYNSYTNTTNNERGFVRWGSNRFQVGTISIGTGTARTCEITFYTSASDPTSADITSGYFSVWKNSGTGIVKLWVNDGGTMKSVALV